MERFLSYSHRLWGRLPGTRSAIIALYAKPKWQAPVRNFHTRPFLANTSQAARAPDNRETQVTAPSDEESGILYANITDTPPRIVGSKGAYLYTADGREILDATGGAAVVSIGHNHPRVKEAIIRQLDRVAYSWSPLFTTEAAEKLAKELVDSTHGHMSKVFVVSSGE
jgi:4-aminobutyrate aminotransferase-like enzyme